jgi:hypothetical protein
MTDNQSTIDNVLNKAAKTAGEDLEKKAKAAADGAAQQFKEYDTKAAAQKVVDSSLNSIIDEAVKKARKDKGAKSDEELQQYIKDTIRAHKNSFFNSDRLLDVAVKDTKKQLDSMIDKQVKEMINTKALDQAMRPFNVAMHKLDLGINSKLAQSIRFDVTKQIDGAIGAMLKDPLHDVNVTLNKLHLGGLSKELASQMGNIQHNITSGITKNISSSILAEQKKIATVQKQILEVQKQVLAFEQKLKDQVKTLQDQVNAELKEAEKKLVDDIKKSIKIKL